MNALVTFDFSIGHYNGTMSMKMVSNQKVLLDIKQFETEKFSFTTKLDWPHSVEFFLSNKGNLDTLVDEQGNVVKDKFIKLENLTVDLMPVHILSLLDLAVLDTGTQVLKQTYWGYNGIAKIEFDKPDTFSWHLNLLSKKNKNSDHVYTIPSNRFEGTLGSTQ